ncbi:MAG: hypothetical protein JRJ58_06925, partial [Deltaproteobacteria bacterium]|nr:hypothetical protein [Deltaproteobacteria bacterium]
PGVAQRLASALLIPLVALTSLACSVEDPQQAASEAREHGTAAADASLELHIRQLLSNEDGLERARSISALLQATPIESLEDVLAGFQTSRLDHGDIELTLCAKWWARFDPESAFLYAQRNWRMDHPRVLSSIVRAWARQDPRSAFEFGIGRQSLAGSPFFRNEVVDALIVGWTESGKPGAFEFAVRIADMGIRQRALRTLARLRVAHHGPEATLDWASEAPGVPDNVRRHLVQATVSVAAKEAPRLAASWIDSVGLENFKEAGLSGRVAASWAESEPEAALAWAATIEPGWDRKDAVRRATTAWWDTDPDAAAAWVRNQAPAPWLDPAQGIYLRRTVMSSNYHVDWESMLDDFALATIQDEDDRWGMVAWLLQRWLIVDEPAARSWILEEQDLPARYRRALETIPNHLAKEILAAYGSPVQS